MPAAPDRDDADSPRDSRRGDLALFALYCLLYAGFMGLAAFRQDLMARPVFGGVNLAVVYGMGLIVAAIALAGISLTLRRREVRP